MNLKRFDGKEIVVRFLDENNEIKVSAGTLTDWCEGTEDEEGYIIVESETDFDRIPLSNVRKIFLKE